MRIIFVTMLFLSGLYFVNAQNKNKNKMQTDFSSIQIDTLFQDKISIRAIVLDNDKVWYAGDKNRFGFYDLKSNKKFENTIVEDTLKIEFRSIAKTAKLYIMY